MPIKVVDIIVERRGKILLIKRGDYWILPGGEIEPGQDELQCLEEVVAREMKDQVASIFTKLEGTIKGTSPVRGGDVEIIIYVGDIGSKKMSDVKIVEKKLAVKPKFLWPFGGKLRSDRSEKNQIMITLGNNKSAV